MLGERVGVTGREGRDRARGRATAQLERGQERVLARIDQAARLQRCFGEPRARAKHSDEREDQSRTGPKEEPRPERDVLGAMQGQKERGQEREAGERHDAERREEARPLDRAPEEEPARSPEHAKQGFVGGIHRLGLNASPHRSRG